MTTSETVAALLTPEAVRARCGELFDLGVTGSLPWFSVDLSQMAAATRRVVGEIRQHYPAIDVPFHSRWRHFEFEGKDLWAALRDAHGVSVEDCSTAADLAIVSVLLDAGAGPDWVYADTEGDNATGYKFGRSEGLALASLRLFESGALSADAKTPLRVDAAALQALTPEALATQFQVSDSNPLVGIEQRAGLLQRLGKVIETRPDIFTRNGTTRPGHLVAALAEREEIAARDILISVLENLTEIWPSPVRLDGVPLGDVGRHQALVRNDETNSLVPFHKLSQWMSYSLIEPLQAAGVKVADLDGLTGLAEYRNGGLFLDAGVLQLKDPALAAHAHRPTDEIIVEWRALTIILLDRIAESVRTELDTDLPLASVLQGGTWSAGRIIAAEKRPGGPPPLTLASDATVF